VITECLNPHSYSGTNEEGEHVVEPYYQLSALRARTGATTVGDHHKCNSTLQPTPGKATGRVA